MDLTKFPTTAIEFDDRFSSEEACRAYLVATRWPEGFRCPRCGHGAAWDLGRRHLFQCRACGHQASLTAGTMLHGTRKPLRLWFKAIFLAAGQTTGTSAKNLKRLLGLRSYQTAWTWLHKIRRAMVRPAREPLTGPVEADETYLGPGDDGARGRSSDGKCIVAIAVEVRDEAAGRARLKHILDASADSLQPFVEQNVTPASTLRTDGWAGYNGVRAAGYQHRVRRLRGRHELASRWFPHVHRVASLLKRWLLGTYQGAVQPKHLQTYLEEFVFRFNRRRSRTPTLPFRRVCEVAVMSRPPTYRELTQDVGVA